MRDDRNRWTPPQGADCGFSIGAVTCRLLALPRQTLVSGPTARADHAPVHGWPEVVTGEAYTIALRRDRVVRVGGDVVPEGWDRDAGLARSDISGGWAVIELDGKGAISVLKRGTELSLDRPSASVVRKLFGLDVWLYRHGTEDRFRLHIVHALTNALIGNLEAAARFEDTAPIARGSGV